jgi:hypothetical protein
MEQDVTIVVIGAYPHFKDGKWQTSGVGDPGDHAGATFDRFRVLAGFALSQKYPNAKLLLSGGAQHEGEPSCAKVLEDELSELGVAKERMELEERSQSVHQQLYEIGKLAGEKHLPHLLIITNDWHHPRLKAMMEHAPKLEMWKDISWERIDAEQVMLDSGNADWAAMVAAERSHPKFAERVGMEEQGVRDVIAGVYRYKPFA